MVVTRSPKTIAINGAVSVASVALVGVGVWQLAAGSRLVGFVLVFVGVVCVGAVIAWLIEGEGDTAAGALGRALAELFSHWP
jgi:hypothetical protein